MNVVQLMDEIEEESPSIAILREREKQSNNDDSVAKIRPMVGEIDWPIQDLKKPPV